MVKVSEEINQEVIAHQAELAGGPSTVLGVLDLFATSKAGIQKFSDLLIQEVEDGNLDPLRVALFMKTLEKIKEAVNEKLGPRYLSEAAKYGGKPFQYRGAEISTGETGVKYDYSVCNHPGWNDLEKIIKEATEQKKEIETTLKTYKRPQGIVTEDGEAVSVFPPVKSGSEGIKISIK